jgi:hypothetical protein
LLACRPKRRRKCQSEVDPVTGNALEDQRKIAGGTVYALLCQDVFGKGLTP